jgi:hypothetical protein
VDFKVAQKFLDTLNYSRSTDRKRGSRRRSDCSGGRRKQSGWIREAEQFFLETWSPLQFVLFKLAANVEALGSAFQLPFNPNTEPILVAWRVISEKRILKVLDGVLFVPPSTSSSTFDDGVEAKRKLNQIAATIGATCIVPSQEIASCKVTLAR